MVRNTEGVTWRGRGAEYFDSPTSYGPYGSNGSRESGASEASEASAESEGGQRATEAEGAPRRGQVEVALIQTGWVCDTISNFQVQPLRSYTFDHQTKEFPALPPTASRSKP